MIGSGTSGMTSLRSDLWPQLFSDVNCIALWISSEKILTRLYSVLHWFHKRLEANVKNPRENRCFQTVIVFSFGLSDNSNKCTVLWKIAARLITVSTSVNKEMWVKLSVRGGMGMAETTPSDAQDFVTAQVDLQVAGTRVQFALTVPTAPVPPGAILPVFQTLSEAIQADVASGLEEQGKRISCRAGCGACCRQLVPITKIEARYLAELVDSMP